ncbi:hypothetical protein [Chryseobacterium gleum]|uniref:hypothetical protein n=1 Tax=Chryseobacterium gleum TaxID=250 RepID=UPI001E618C86|nr:hypothetical protein [Chryseobacterium gleum]MCE4066117.1 hypothetical protein [Chryseobacterium gleum]
MNKKILLVLASSLAMFQYTNAQVRTNGFASGNIAGQGAFLDASGSTGGFTDSVNDGKGLVFPRTNLTTFTFATPVTDEDNFPTAYDGMIVYNTATGTTVSGIATSVTPGYYYFSNPTGGTANGFATSTGRWVSLSTSPKVTVGTTETTTNTIINTTAGDKQLYAIKGTFTASGTSTAVNIPAPAGMSAMYGITIYKAGTNTVYDRSLYSYTIATTAGNAITGSPSMSVVYPSGTYDYVLEYLK